MHYLTLKNGVNPRICMFELLKNGRLFIGTVIVFVIVLVAIFASLIAPYDPLEFHIADGFSPPCSKYWLGTDQYGRDTFSRVVAGSRVTLLMGITCAFISLAAGTFIGITLGLLGGWLDEVVMRICDLIIAVPSLLFSVIIVAALGGSISNAILAVSVPFIPRVARVLRSMAQNLREERFVKAAEARGESTLYIAFSEILPNTWPVVTVEGSQRVAFAIFTATSISFLGLGAQPPTPEWGLMIRFARDQVFLSPYALLFPSIAVTLAILGFNLLGDGLNDVLVRRS